MERWMGMTFAEVVRFHRKRLGLTQEGLAEKMGRDYSRVSKVEQGHTFRRLPDADEFRAWAEGLEVSPAQMLKQMGYIDEEETTAKRKQPELVFTSLADEIANADHMPAEVQDTMLDGLKQARRLYDALKQRNGVTTGSS
jgi:transcriptional regulator with XRE-family HTH domain